MNPWGKANETKTNGSASAALLASGIGCFTLAALAFAADKSAALKLQLIFYRPTGPLSGVTSVALAIWIILWLVLDWRWKNRSIALGRITQISISLLVLALLLTFPPFADLLPPH
jgi:hypothetical protein